MGWLPRHIPGEMGYLKLLESFFCLLSIFSISVRRQVPSRCQQMTPWAGYEHPRHRSFSVQNTASGGAGTNAVQVRLSTLRLIPSLIFSSFQLLPIKCKKDEVCSFKLRPLSVSITLFVPARPPVAGCVRPNPAHNPRFAAGHFGSSFPVQQ